MIVGCAVGFLNFAKFKYAHNAIKSSILIAECIYELFFKNEDKLVNKEKLKKSSINNEFYETRNFK